MLLQLPSSGEKLEKTMISCQAQWHVGKRMRQAIPVLQPASLRLASRRDDSSPNITYYFDVTAKS